jgi:site-specific DNA-methyltransferase (adenine-specific)
MIELVQGDNIQEMASRGYEWADLIYADTIYEDKDLWWVNSAVLSLKKDGVIIVQTDYHSVAQYKLKLEEYGLKFVNWCIYKQEWGGTSKRFFSRKHDDILIYANGADYKFRAERVQIPKATAGTAFDKKGTGMKTPCDVFDDLGNFSTMSKERVKGPDGKNIKWQKPLKLMNRLLLPFSDEGDMVLDPFLGSGTTAVWCKQNNRSCVGIEHNPNVFKIAQERVNAL